MTGEPFPNPAEASYSHTLFSGNENDDESVNSREGVLPNIGTSEGDEVNGVRNLSVDAQLLNKKTSIPMERCRSDLMN